jgi:protein-tyrosine phosphatase
MNQPEKLNFDNEALKIFAQLQSSGVRSTYNHADIIWQDNETGGKLYIGNQTAASDRSVLDKLGITRIVNCTSDVSLVDNHTTRIMRYSSLTPSHHAMQMPNYHEGSPDIQYYNFDISNHWKRLDASEESVTRFVVPLFTFIDKALGEGRGVMVHCLAGAHRAGTTGVACFMYKTGLNDYKQATALVQKLRPIVQPIGTLPQFLQRLERWLNNQNAGSSNL